MSPVRMITILAGILVPAAAAASGSTQLEAANLPYMLRGYFRAASHVSVPSGYAISDNRPSKIGDPVPPGVLSLVAFPHRPERFEGLHAGFRVVLANATTEAIDFPASDSVLSVVREALDETGSWRPVEYLPRSWCGNSYHSVSLPPGEAWTFVAPVYTGTMETRMRFVLLGEDGKTPRLISNEFPGRVNQAQFTQRQGHSPTSVMDPYDE